MPLLKDVSQLAFTFQELAETASLYATKRTYAAICDALAQMTQGSRLFAESLDDAPEPTPEQATETYKSSIAGMERVYDLLARDMRSMLGLERLEEHRALDTDP